MLRNLVVLLALFTLTVVVHDTAQANYGGSNGYQQEEREDDFCANYSNQCFGRCGPGCSTFFGTAVTTQCQNHDACIRDYKCAGHSDASAHANCLTGSRGLGRAAWSVIQYHWDNWISKAKAAVDSTWANVCSSC